MVFIYSLVMMKGNLVFYIWKWSVMQELHALGKKEIQNVTNVLFMDIKE